MPRIRPDNTRRSGTGGQSGSEGGGGELLHAVGEVDLGDATVQPLACSSAVATVVGAVWVLVLIWAAAIASRRTRPARTR